MINTIIRSLLITTIISLVAGGLINYLLGYNILKVIVTAFVIQFVFFYVYNSIVQLIMSNRFEREQTRQAEYFSKQGVDVNCAHCSNVNFIPITMSDTNEFVCEVCGKSNSVYVDITVAQKTDIIDKQSVNIILNNKEKQDAERRIRKQDN